MCQANNHGWQSIPRLHRPIKSHYSTIIVSQMILIIKVLLFNQQYKGNDYTNFNVDLEITYMACKTNAFIIVTKNLMLHSVYNKQSINYLDSEGT